MLTAICSRRPRKDVPLDRLRDRVLFETAYACGTRAARVGMEIHQLRHAHATELINSGVSIEAVRRRLGHASTETTQL